MILIHFNLPKRTTSLQRTNIYIAVPKCPLFKGSIIIPLYSLIDLSNVYPLTCCLHAQHQLKEITAKLQQCQEELDGVMAEKNRLEESCNKAVSQHPHGQLLIKLQEELVKVRQDMDEVKGKVVDAHDVVVSVQDSVGVVKDEVVMVKDEVFTVKDAVMVKDEEF